MGRPILILGGRVIDPASGMDAAADLAIAEGRIVAIGPGLARPSGVELIDATGCLVTPGLIDPHVHLREPGQEHKETIESGTRAAVAGGFTTVCCMPNTSPALDTPEMIRLVRARAQETGHCRVFPVGAVSVGRKGERLTEIALMHRAGAVGFSDDGDVVASAGLMARALGMVKTTGRALMQHCQEVTLTSRAAMHAGSVAVRFGLPGWPRAAEELIIERDVRLNREIQCPYHVQHISSGDSVEIVRRAQREGVPVTAEATPHHLLLTHEAVDRGGVPDANAKVNPPLREDRDVKAILEGVADGTIGVLGTDHAPHAPHEKSLPFEEAPMGMVGLETALALYIKALVTPGLIDWMRLIHLMTTAPAALCGLDAIGLGRLAVGGPADVTVIDPDESWTIRAEALESLSRNTPFDGWAVRGRARATIIGGRLAFAHMAGDAARR